MFFWEIEIGDGSPQKQKSKVKGQILGEYNACQTAIGMLAFAIAPYINGVITQISLSSLLALPSNNPVAASPYSNVEKKVIFMFKASGRRTRFSIPCVPTSFFVEGELGVIPEFENAVSTIILNNNFSDSHLINIDEFVKSLKSHGRS